MDFNELVETLQNGGDDVPETIYDDLRGAYQLTVDGSSEALAARDAEIQARDEEIARLKAMNFELLTAAPANVEDSESESPDDTAEVFSGGIDDLFN